MHVQSRCVQFCRAHTEAEERQLNSEALSTTVRYLKVMAHATRLRILGILADGEWSVSELAELLDTTSSTVLRHLAKLQEVDLVRMRMDDANHVYSLNDETLQRINRDLISTASIVAIGEESVGDAWEQRVLTTFLDGDRLTKIPDKPRKRLVILTWLVQKFAPGVRYPEAQVNAIIRRHHDDTAMLRRELIAARLMQRDGGVYWRVD
ncbi:MAG: ArsR family transcriptional regulator [Roseiflexus castenholzii]|nr:MAG: ArsR family transcriptional regulator [Roseiflexus castenholzii]